MNIQIVTTIAFASAQILLGLIIFFVLHNLGNMLAQRALGTVGVKFNYSEKFGRSLANNSAASGLSWQNVFIALSGFAVTRLVAELLVRVHPNQYQMFSIFFVTLLFFLRLDLVLQAIFALRVYLFSKKNVKNKDDYNDNGKSIGYYRDLSFASVELSSMSKISMRMWMSIFLVIAVLDLFFFRSWFSAILTALV